MAHRVPISTWDSEIGWNIFEIKKFTGQRQYFILPVATLRKYSYQTLYLCVLQLFDKYYS